MAEMKSPGLLGLPHFKNSRVSVDLMEPVYLNWFTVQIQLPTALGLDEESNNLLLEEVTKISGLDSHKFPTATTQKYKFADRSFIGAKPDNTYMDLSLDFEVNLQYNDGDAQPHNFVVTTLRKWCDLAYDPLTGRAGLKKDYCAASMIITMQDRAGTPYWQWYCHNVFPISKMPSPNLDYNNADLFKVTNFQLRVDYWDEIQL